ncbi:hypothetical protein EKG38_24685 [Shewanella canadensis]|uniref:Uncharacterized protein n=1 Tax=Shewanella canadensis TaxID=271096 RepID=A0A431WJF2_9GAMM|nr:hypothetical protein [Shewanella canadensis]RTR35484.1 hypothetical protein EKG38_24685 [Shewanella canadensis]
MSQAVLDTLDNPDVQWEQKIAAARQGLAEQSRTINNLIRRIAALENAPAAAAPAPSGGGYSKKIEVFNDPGEYDGSKAKFEEWWAKMRAWLKLNEHAIAPESHEAVLAVLSRLKGAKAGPFAQTCITKGTAYTWAELVSDIKGLL